MGTVRTNESPLRTKRTYMMGQINVLDCLKLMRPHQWVKNVFAFFGIIFSQHYLDIGYVIKALEAFVAFCLLSSAVYVANDIYDREADRRHPVKCMRPLAKGTVSVQMAIVLIVVLLIAFVCVCLIINSSIIAILGATYIVNNLLYTFWAKRIPILDVFSITGGFMLRLLAGTAGIGIAISPWMFLCGFLLTLFIGFGKRRAEMGIVSNDNRKTRKVLEFYTVGLLDIFLGISGAAAIITYALYTLNPDTIHRFGSSYLVVTVPIAVYGIFRYLYLIFTNNRGEDTARDLLDLHIVVTVLLWIAVFIGIRI